MTTYIEQLIQIHDAHNEGVTDGNLISKKEARRLAEEGLIVRSEGRNFITNSGYRRLRNLGLRY